jgi:hypothetical protein
MLAAAIGCRFPAISWSGDLTWLTTIWPITDQAAEIRAQALKIYSGNDAMRRA